MTGFSRPGQCALAIFARAPVAGHCKTRLIPRLGPDGAARLQERLTAHMLETAAAADIGPVVLWCAPDAGHPFFARCVERFGVALRPQQGEDLGARMAFAFAQAQGPLLLTGTDCPSIRAQDLQACARALNEGAQAVFLPAEDGGYGLVGLNRPAPFLFEAMAWSTPSVMEETRARLVRAGLRWREIRVIWDVDEPADVDRLTASGLVPEIWT